MAGISTHTFTGDREARQEWLVRHTGYRIADVYFPDGSVLFYASHVAYDVREGAALELPTADAVAELAAGVDDVPPAVRETLAEASARTVTSTTLADLLVEAARTALPDDTGEGRRERYAIGKRLRRNLLPEVIGRVLDHAPDGARNEALRAVANTRRLE
ncbi:hypothetical protein ACIP3A_39470 [Streptomyces tricolor]|uniref:hypothetical protein n=1 Tax=Streptomyces tricolor TaxID=68277 RepID=UPI0037F60FB3